MKKPEEWAHIMPTGNYHLASFDERVRLVSDIQNDATFFQKETEWELKASIAAFANLTRRLSEVEDGLKFYADKKNWGRIPFGEENDCDEPCFDDEGDIARKLLGIGDE